MNQSFEGIWVPIVTPFLGDAVDHPALAALARHLVDAGIHGLIAGATTGEGATLTDAEHEAILGTLRDTVGSRVPIVAGLCGTDTRTVAALARRLETLRPDGFLITAPPYLRPSQAGIQRHVETIVAATNLPAILYNIPYRSGVNMELETLQALSADPRIVGIKECGATVDRLMTLIHETALRVFIGEDSQFFAALCLGAHGAIAASAHVRPDLWVRIFQLLRANRLDEARTLAVTLQPLVRALFVEPNPAPVKACLAHAGPLAGKLSETVRLPLITASPACRSNLLRVCQSLQGL